MATALAAGDQHRHQEMGSNNRKVGNQFVNMLVAEWKRVCNRKWNSDKLIIFGAIILQKAYGLRKSCDIQKCILNRMKL